MKGEKNYQKADLILTSLYNNNYLFEGKTYSKKDLYNEYLKFLRKAAYAAFPQAQYELGQTYEDVNFWGVNNSYYSPSRCIYWYTKAAEQNHAAAHNNLAGFYEDGIGVPQDIKKALELYKRSGELGDVNGKKNYKIMLKQIKEGKYNL